MIGWNVDIAAFTLKKIRGRRIHFQNQLNISFRQCFIDFIQNLDGNLFSNLKTCTFQKKIVLFFLHLKK